MVQNGDSESIVGEVRKAAEAKAEARVAAAKALAGALPGNTIPTISSSESHSRLLARGKSRVEGLRTEEKWATGYLRLSSYEPKNRETRNKVADLFGRELGRVATLRLAAQLVQSRTVTIWDNRESPSVKADPPQGSDLFDWGRKVLASWSRSVEPWAKDLLNAKKSNPYLDNDDLRWRPALTELDEGLQDRVFAATVLGMQDGLQEADLAFSSGSPVDALAHRLDLAAASQLLVSLEHGSAAVQKKLDAGIMQRKQLLDGVVAVLKKDPYLSHQLADVFGPRPGRGEPAMADWLISISAILARGRDRGAAVGSESRAQLG